MHLSRLFYLFTCLVLFNCNVDKKSNVGKSVFYYNQASGIGSLDPAFASNQANIWATTQLFNGLVELDDSMHVKPCLAHSWEVSQDQKQYTFHLRNKVFFHDHPVFEGGKGRKMDAYDVAYSLNRIIDSTGVFNKGMWIFKDKVLKKTDGTLSDTCFVAKNDSMFVIHLNEPFPFFLEILAMPYCFVVPRDVCAHYGQEFRSNPVGTGPFQLHLWEEQTALVLHKNEQYWKTDKTGQQLPYLDAVQVSFTADKGQTFRSFLLGDIDFISGVDESMIDEVLKPNGQFQEAFVKKYTTSKSPYLNTEYLCFQLDTAASCYGGKKDHPFLNPAFRKALSFSVNREDLIRYLKNGLGTPGRHGIVPTAVPYYNYSQVKGAAFNLDSARYYLQQSGVDLAAWPNLSLTVSAEHKALSEILMKQWEEFLQVKIAIDLADVKVYRSRAEQGAIPFFRASWLGDYPDAESYLSLFYSPNFTPNGPNKSRFKDETYDSLFVVSKSIYDPEERAKVYQQMDQRMIRQAPVIVLFYDETLRLTQSTITGLQVNAMNVLRLEMVEKHPKKLD